MSEQRYETKVTVNVEHDQYWDPAGFVRHAIALALKDGHPGSLAVDVEDAPAPMPVVVPRRFAVPVVVIARDEGEAETLIDALVQGTASRTEKEAIEHIGDAEERESF